MPFREKSAWIALVSTTLFYGAYFLTVMPPLIGPQEGGSHMLGAFLGALFVLVILQIVLHVAAAALAPKDAQAPRDEREQMIELRAMRVAFYVAQTGAFCALAALLWRNEVALLANLVLLSMVVAEIARAGVTVFGFRRAAA
jgi:hypothetical protein